MVTKENRYDFYKRLLPVHRPDRRNKALTPAANEWAFPNITVIRLPENADKVVRTAALDFVDYLITSMNVSACLTFEQTGFAHVNVSIDSDVPGPIGYRITTSTDGVMLVGSDPRGTAQGFYSLEDRMNLRCAPFLEHGTVTRRSRFRSRAAHSPFGMFEYNDECFAWMAHLGYSSISLWLKDSGTSLRGDTVNVNLLCERAEKYGIRVSACLFQLHDRHPDDPGSQEYYDKLYGDFFAACPKLSGVGLVGESQQFQSRDPRVGKSPNTANYHENIPTGKMSPGWWPCEDYPKWVEMIMRAIKKAKPDAGVGFSTYNWGFAPEEDRIALINALPEGISIGPTWDMFEQFERDGVTEDIVDYTLSFTGPGRYFVSEAEAVHKRGLGLSINAQSGGRTWDFGVVPYEPMPYAWIDRYEAIVEATKKWNITGITECIHYGFWPSIISYLEKEAFFTDGMPLRELLPKLIAAEFGADHVETIDKTFRLWSDAIRYMISTNEDQYGSLRTGPSYPLWLTDVNTLPDFGRVPMNNNPMHPGIYYTYYKENVSGRNSLPSVRRPVEIASLQKMTELLKEGVALLESIPDRNEELERLLLLGKYIVHSAVTAIHAKRFFTLKARLFACESREGSAALLDEIEQVMLAERANVEAAIPVAELDSRLGWEPSMEYVGDAYCLRWKLRQLDYELNTTLKVYRKANALGTPDYEKYADAQTVIFH